MFRTHSIFTILFFLVFQPPEAKSQELKIGSGTQFQQGVVKLEWTPTYPKTPVTFELEQAANLNFEDSDIIYQGTDHGTFLSGLPDGTYYYRLRTANGNWSEPLEVTIKHHSLPLALILFCIGAMVFLLVVGVILKGAKNGQ